MSLEVTDEKSALAQEIIGSTRQQAITWGNIDPDLCPYMESLGHKELPYCY